MMPDLVRGVEYPAACRCACVWRHKRRWCADMYRQKAPYADVCIGRLRDI